jgi:hypothetical protein
MLLEAPDCEDELLLDENPYTLPSPCPREEDELTLLLFELLVPKKELWEELDDDWGVPENDEEELPYVVVSEQPTSKPIHGGSESIKRIVNIYYLVFLSSITSSD